MAYSAPAFEEAPTELKTTGIPIQKGTVFTLSPQRCVMKNVLIVLVGIFVLPFMGGWKDMD